MEEEKALVKFTSSPKEKHHCLNAGSICRILLTCVVFLEKGTPAQYGSSKYQHQQPYSKSQNRSQNYSLNSSQDHSRSSQSSSFRGQLVGPINDCMCFEQLNVILSHILRLQSLLPSARLCNWQVITANHWVFQVVQSTGWSLQLSRIRGCPLINYQHQSAVEEQVQKLLTKGEWNHTQNSSQQAVLGEEEKDLLLRDDWMASIDLKDAYLSVAVEEEHRSISTLSGQIRCTSFDASYFVWAVPWGYKVAVIFYGMWKKYPS